MGRMNRSDKVYLAHCGVLLVLICILGIFGYCLCEITLVYRMGQVELDQIVSDHAIGIIFIVGIVRIINRSILPMTDWEDVSEKIVDNRILQLQKILMYILQFIKIICCFVAILLVVLVFAREKDLFSAKRLMKNALNIMMLVEK